MYGPLLQYSVPPNPATLASLLSVTCSIWVPPRLSRTMASFPLFFCFFFPFGWDYNPIIAHCLMSVSTYLIYFVLSYRCFFLLSSLWWARGIPYEILLLGGK